MRPADTTPAPFDVSSYETIHGYFNAFRPRFQAYSSLAHAEMNPITNMSKLSLSKAAFFRLGYNSLIGGNSTPCSNQNTNYFTIGQSYR